MSVRVVLGYHHWGQVHARFMSSVCRALVYEGRKVSDIIDIPSPYVTESRNKLVFAFLEKTKAKYLLMLDADMEFPEDAISRMIWLAEMNRAHVLGANYALGDFGNSIFGPAKDSDLVCPLVKVEPNTIYNNAGGVATGFLLLERSCLEAFRAPGSPFMDNSPWFWFDHDRTPTSAALIKDMAGFDRDGYTKMGEDMSFSRRAVRLGYEVMGTTHIPLIHHKFKPTVPDDQVLMFSPEQKVVSKVTPWMAKYEEMVNKKLKEKQDGKHSEGDPVPQERLELVERQEDPDRGGDNDPGLRGGGAPPAGPVPGSDDSREVGGDRNHSSGPAPQGVQVEVRRGTPVRRGEL